MVMLWMTGTLLSFTVSAVSVRILGRTVGVFDILSARSAAGIAILGAAMLLSRQLRGQLRLRRPGLHLLRNLPHSVGQISWTYALTVLPLATVFSLEFTSPVWLTLLAVAVLGERLTIPRAGAVALGIAGVLVILRPGLAGFQPASFAALAAAIAFAINGAATKFLTRTESTISILFWMNVIQLPINLIGVDPAFPSRIEGSQWMGLAGFCLAGVTAHLCLTQAFRHGDATVVVPLDFLRIPLIALIGWRFYGEPLDGFVFAGAGIIIAGILWNLASEARRPPTSSRRPGSGPGS